MARHPRCRKVCSLPVSSGFVPRDFEDQKEEIILTVEEYETLRLIDVQGFSQEECGKYMDVARTTVQQIYSDARRKVSLAIVEGRPLRISGGAYRLCDGKEEYCGCGGCRKHSQCQGKMEVDI